MCQLWLKTPPYNTLLQNDSFFTFIFAVFLLNLFYRCMLLHKPIYGVAVLKNQRKPYWNTTCSFNLVIVVINTSFADAK